MHPRHTVESYDPVDDARVRHPEWTIMFTDLGGISEVICWNQCLAYIDSAATDRRRAAAHTVAHLDLHQAERIDPFTPQQEHAASVLAEARLGSEAA